MKTKNRQQAIDGFNKYLKRIANPTLEEIQARPPGFIKSIQGKLQFVKRQIASTQFNLERNAK